MLIILRGLENVKYCNLIWMKICLCIIRKQSHNYQTKYSYLDSLGKINNKKAPKVKYKNKLLKTNWITLKLSKFFTKQILFFEFIKIVGYSCTYKPLQINEWQASNMYSRSLQTIINVICLPSFSLNLLLSSYLLQFQSFLSSLLRLQ